MEKEKLKKFIEEEKDKADNYVGLTNLIENERCKTKTQIEEAFKSRKRTLEEVEEKLTE